MSHETKEKSGVKEDERDGMEEREYEKKEKPFEWSWGKRVLKGVEGKKDEERSIERSGGKEDEGIKEERRRAYYYMKVETIL